MFSVRILAIDSYQAAPISNLDETYSEFRGTEIKRVPTIRIFGSTPTGEKVCLHIHGAFPYIYIPCTIRENIGSYVYRLSTMIDNAINVSLGYKIFDNQHVHKIQQVRGIPFYGYHEKEHLFFKIYFYNPAIVKKAADLLQDGTVFNYSVQPHEAHIPFTLQFMIDYNLYGMNFINVSRVKHRWKARTTSMEEITSEDSPKTYNSQEYLPISIVRQSICELEADARVNDILNCEALLKGLELNPGLSAIWEEERVRRSNAGLEKAQSQLLYPKDLDKLIVSSPTASHNYHKQRLMQRIEMISQIESTTLLPGINELSYPLELKTEDIVPNTLHVLKEMAMSSVVKENHKNVKELAPSSSFLSLERTLSSNQTSDLSFLNVDDIQLVELLVNLSKDKDTDSVVDDNSILGSQYSSYDQDVPSDNEYDEDENLNVTSLDLCSLSSWNSITSTKTIENELSTVKEPYKDKESTNEPEDNTKASTSLYFPQYDGADDESVEVGTKEKTTKTTGNPVNREDKKISGTSMSHKNTNTALSGSLSSFDNTIDRQIVRTCSYKLCKGMNTNQENSDINISSLLLDENPIKSSDNSVSKYDITIDRQDECACNYRPCEKSDYENVVNVNESQRKHSLKMPTYDTYKKTKRVGDKILNERTIDLEKQLDVPYTRFTTRNFDTISVPMTSDQGTKTQQERNIQLSLKFGEGSNDFNKNMENDRLNKTYVLDLPSTSITIDTISNNIGTVSNSDNAITEYDAIDSENLIQNVISSHNSSKNIQEKEHPQKVTHTSKVEKEQISDTNNFINELSLLEDTNDPNEINCNTTFTQYIEERMKYGNQSLLADRVTTDTKKTETPITIITKFNPPNRKSVLSSLDVYNISRNEENKEPFFSNKMDLIKHKATSSVNNRISSVVPFKSVLEDITGIKLWRRMKVNEFYPSGGNIKLCHMRRILTGYNNIVIRPLYKPPARKSTVKWLQKREMPAINTKNSPKEQSQSSTASENDVSLSRKALENSSYNNAEVSQHLGVSYGQIEYSTKTLSNASNDNFQKAKSMIMHQYLTLLTIETHIVTRGNLLPDPQYDPIEGIFYAIQNDVPISSKLKQMEHGAIVVNKSNDSCKFNSAYLSLVSCPVLRVKNEEDLFKNLITLINRCDPDILLGWEIESLSWGYIFQRASHIGFNFLSLRISRIPTVLSENKNSIREDSTEIKVPGRLLLNVWKIMRHEVALLSYTFESVMYNVMHERISCPNFKTLTAWWRHSSNAIYSRVIDHYVLRTLGVLKILSHLDIIGRTCEHARLFGIQFYEVFSRGSQFRVESMMLRLAKPLNYVPVSPSVKQRAKMRAPESLPLIMEPESKFYTDPLIVLDFQSLYPSIIIAYNYCFSTCLGRVEHMGQEKPFEFGATMLKTNKETVSKLQERMNFSPCGVAFAKAEVRKGVMPRMLAEILNTRLMVKESMKLYPAKDHTLQRVLHSQQLGLKLIANVTYGYTAANFSGRMPCIEIGDSVVSKGRETLERAIKMVESTAKWGARVVYGDTDSLFLLLPGKTRREAFDIGAEIADTVTAANPPPVKLKFEKVMQPCILQTKKRYCGYMYESPDQTKPEYLAKGIETVRRDGCPAVAKILEKSLKILFDTKDISLLKFYIVRQFDKILRRRASIQDLTFAKEFRGMHGYKPNAFVPALELTRRLIRTDPRAIPRTGERVPYIIVAGEPNQALIHCVRSPWEVLLDPSLNPNSVYYITKVITPPLNRCLKLLGIDVDVWYREMPHRQTFDNMATSVGRNQKFTISQFFSTTLCVVCNEQSNKEVCAECTKQPSQTVVTLYEKMRWLEHTYYNINAICHSCVGRLDEPECASLDCPVLYRTNDARRSLAQISHLNSILTDERT